MCGQYLGVARAQVEFGGKFLSGFAPQVLQVFFGGGARAFFLDDAVYGGNGAFGKDGVARIDDFKLVRCELFADVVGFVLKGNQHVADVALAEGGGGRAASVFKDGGVFQKGGGKFFSLVFITVVCFQSVAVCAEEGVAAVAGGFRVGDDDLHTVFGQIGPVFNLFGIAFAHEEYGGAGIGHGVVGQAFGPVGFNQPFLFQEFDVGSLVHGYDVGGQAVGDRQGLFARTAVRLLYVDGFAVVLGLVFFGEQGIVFFVKITGDVVGNVQQFDALAAVGCGGGRFCGGILS